MMKKSDGETARIQPRCEMASMRRPWNALIMLFYLVCLAFAAWVLLELVDVL
jgi:hypothetical protein